VNGITGDTYVSPSIRPGVAVNDVATLNPAMIELRLKKDGLERPKRKSGNLYTVAFKARQEVK
jgi:hypothetical protein